jgi:hypothetical protein
MARRKVSVKNLRVAGQRIPDGLFREIAEELIPGPGPTESQLKHGAPSKAQMQVALCTTDRTWRVRVQKAVLSRKTAETKKMAAEHGYVLPEGDETALGKSNEQMDRETWEVYRRTARYDLESLGQAAPGMPTKWHTADSDIELLTDEERTYALHVYNERKAGRIVDAKKFAPPEYIPSGTDWHEVQRLVLEMEKAGK